MGKQFPSARIVLRLVFMLALLAYGCSEKPTRTPKPEDAPTTLGVVGRYILTPRIFELLESTPRGAGGALLVGDGLRPLDPL